MPILSLCGVAKESDNKAIILKEFGNRLREARLARGLSQHELANQCDMEYSQINRIELGKINTSIVNLQKFAKVLDIKASALVDFQW